MNELFRHETNQMAEGRQEIFFRRDGLYDFAKNEGLDPMYTRCATKNSLKKK